MNDFCFCHITDALGNKYVVKDKEAREQIKKLQPTDEITPNNEKPITSGAVYRVLNTLSELLDDF
jgi:hypothetical protein